MDAVCDVCGERAVIIGSGISLCREHMDQLAEWQRALEQQAMEAAGLPEAQTCPRRMDDFGPWPREEMLDSWVLRHDYKGELTMSCSFCGSMHPDAFMQAIADGREIGPTDKNYKAYVGPNSAKFYYQHLSVEQRHAFIDHINARTITIGYPGHFYVLPFFVGRAG